MTQRRLTTIVSVAYLATVLIFGLLALRAYESAQEPRSSQPLTEAQMWRKIDQCDPERLWECLTGSEQ